MKEIKLTQNQIALVDDNLFNYLSQFKWRCDSHGYAIHSFREGKKVKSIFMARLIMGEPADRMIDHADRNPLNNQKYNLRIATRGQNRSNSVPSIKTSSYKGVCKIKFNKSNPYMATIKHNKVSHHLGYFKNEQEAALAYNQKASELFGEFANLNNVGAL